MAKKLYLNAWAESDNKIIKEINREYTKEIDILNHEIQRWMAKESTKSDAANLKTEIAKKELSDLEIKMKEEKENLAKESTKVKAANIEATY